MMAYGFYIPEKAAFWANTTSAYERILLQFRLKNLATCACEEDV